MNCITLNLRLSSKFYAGNKKSAFLGKRRHKKSGEFTPDFYFQNTSLTTMVSSLEGPTETIPMGTPVSASMADKYSLHSAGNSS